jgi:hypothetical protein
MTVIQINLPTDLEAKLRAKAAESQVSVDEYVAEAIRERVGGAKAASKPKRDLSGIFDGTPLEPEVLQALDDQRRIDPEMWK